LSIAKGIVDLYGGCITVQSEVTVGTTVMVGLSLADDGVEVE